jgi:hypothetical protein
MATATAPPPRYPDVTPAQWARVEKLVTILVADKAKDHLGDPKDIAAEAIRRAQEPTTREWDRSKSLARHVGSFANSLMANGFRKLAFKTTDAVDPATFEEMNDPAVPPDEAYTEQEARAIADARLTRIRELVADDGCCVILLDAGRRGEKRPHKLAEAGGFTYRQVELAREKIQRAGLKVVEEETRAARKKGYLL